MKPQKRSPRSSRSRSGGRQERRETADVLPRPGGRFQNIDALRSATGITDDAALDILGDLGFTPETVRLLHLVPVVHVAWSEGGMSGRERKLIQGIAQSGGIIYGSQAFEVLTEWIEQPLPHGYFERSLQVIRKSLDEIPGGKRAESVRSIMSNCTRVATASRESATGREGLSAGEHDVLEFIVEALDA